MCSVCNLTSTVYLYIYINSPGSKYVTNVEKVCRSAILDISRRLCKHPFAHHVFLGPCDGNFFYVVIKKQNKHVDFALFLDDCANVSKSLCFTRWYSFEDSGEGSNLWVEILEVYLDKLC